MSKPSVAAQPGASMMSIPRSILPSGGRYANCSNTPNVASLAKNRPPAVWIGPTLEGRPDVFGLIDATSNAKGCVCATMATPNAKDILCEAVCNRSGTTTIAIVAIANMLTFWRNIATVRTQSCQSKKGSYDNPVRQYGLAIWWRFETWRLPCRLVTT